EGCAACLATLQVLSGQDDPLLAELRHPIPPELFSAPFELEPTISASPMSPSHGRDVAAALPVIPGYEIIKELGHGGMGVVYKARQLKANRVVALKMIRAPVHPSLERKVRFKIEAELCARLQHANIVQIHDVDEHEGLPFFSLEFCSGGPLNERLQGRPLPWRKAGELAETLARPVHHAPSRA